MFALYRAEQYRAVSGEDWLPHSPVTGPCHSVTIQQAGFTFTLHLLRKYFSFKFNNSSARSPFTHPGESGSHVSQTVSSVSTVSTVSCVSTVSTVSTVFTDCLI